MYEIYSVDPDFAPRCENLKGDDVPRFIARAKPFRQILTKGPFHGFIDYICNFDCVVGQNDSKFS